MPEEDNHREVVITMRDIWNALEEVKKDIWLLRLTIGALIAAITAVGGVNVFFS